VAHDRVGPDHDQDLLPPRPETTERDPEEPIGRPHPRPRSLGREDGELLVEGQILDQKVGPRRAEASEPIQDCGDSGRHRDRMEAPGNTVNGDSAQDWWQDRASANRSSSGRMGYWRGTGVPRMYQNKPQRLTRDL
jgi:hypothetical protein